jgi:hypothetical protein
MRPDQQPTQSNADGCSFNQRPSARVLRGELIEFLRQKLPDHITLSRALELVFLFENRIYHEWDRESK